MMMQNEQEDDEGFDSKWSECVKNYCINRTEPLNFCWCREICCPVPFHCRQFCNDGLLFLQVLHLLLPLAEVMLLDPASDSVEFVVGVVVDGNTSFSVATVHPLQASTSSSSLSFANRNIHCHFFILLLYPLFQFLPHTVPKSLSGEGVKQTTSPDCFIIMQIFVDHLSRISQYKLSVAFYTNFEIQFISTSPKKRHTLSPPFSNKAPYHSHCIIYAMFLCRSSCLLLQCRLSWLCGCVPLRGHDEACTNLCKILVLAGVWIHCTSLHCKIWATSTYPIIPTSTPIPNQKRNQC